MTLYNHTDAELWVEKDVGCLVALALKQPAEFIKYGKPFALASKYYSAQDLAVILSEVSGLAFSRRDRSLD